MNTISTYGRLTSDVTTRELNGRTIAMFRMASQNVRKQSDGKYGTNFYNVEVGREAQAQNCAKYLQMGNRVTVSGQLVIRTYTGTDQREHQVIEINADTVDFVETKAEAEAKAKAKAKAQNAQATQPALNLAQTPTQVDTDELPF